MSNPHYNALLEDIRKKEEEANKEKREFFERDFKQKKDDPLEWASTAEKLHRAAKVLFEAWQKAGIENGEPVFLEYLELDGPAILLYGLALENIIKGYLIKTTGSFDKAKDKIKDAWQNHQLCNLAISTGLPLSNEQKQLLGSVEAHIRWAGRYPIPLKHTESTIPEQLGTVKDMPPHGSEDLINELLEPLFTKMTKEITEEIVVKGPK